MIEWLNSISPDWANYILAATVQNSVFVAIILAILYMLRNKSVKLLKMISLIGLVKLLIPPFISIEKIETVLPANMSIPDIGLAPFFVESSASADIALSVPSAIMLIWLLFILAVLGFAFSNYVRIRYEIKSAQKLTKSSFPYKTHVNHLQAVLSDKAKSPYILGFFRFYLVLPKYWRHWNEPIRRTIVVHETAHIREGDHWINAIKVLVFSFHFFNPLVWLLFNRINRYSEIICDDHSISANRIQPAEYNSHLIKIAQEVRSQWTCEPVLSFSRAHRMIKNRISYQLNRKDCEVMKRLPFKTKLIVFILGFTMLLFSWQCGKTDLGSEPEKEPGLSSQSVIDNYSAFKFFEVDVKPEMISRAIPQYPDLAKKEGISGMVVITVVIDEQGDVLNATVLDSIPGMSQEAIVAMKKKRLINSSYGLDEAALEAAMQTKFSPARMKGKPVKVIMNIPFRFKLK